MKKNTHLFWVFSVLGGLVLLFILAPLIGLFLKTSIGSVFETLQDDEVRQSIGLTLLVSMLATMFFAFGAIPFAYILARYYFTGKNILLAVINLPIVIPHSAAGIALLGVISRDSWFGRFASSIGLDFVGNPLGIGLAMAFVSIPFLLNSAKDGFAMVPVRLEKGAMLLGASHTRTFFTISLPLARRNILSGFVLMFARGLSEFGAIIIIAYHPMVTPVLIWERFSAFGLKYAQPVAAVFILVTLIVFILLRIISKEPSNRGRNN